VRGGSEAELRGFESIGRVPGDVLEPEGLAEAVEGCAALIHLVGIIREHRTRGITFERLHPLATANMLGVAHEAGVKRYLHMSALGTRVDAPARYHRTKWEAEEVVRASALDWTIFRPSLIYGAGDAFFSMLARLVRRAPLVPVLGPGATRLQPVAVEHVAEGFVRALRTPLAVGQTYEVAGPEAYRFVELLDLVGAAIGRPRVRKVHVPLGLVSAATRAFGWLPFFPVTRGQLVMLGGGNIAPPQRLHTDFRL